MTRQIHVEDRLSQYLDGVLSARDTKLVQEHLATCDACSLAFSDIKKARELLRDQEEVDVPAWFTKKVMARVRQEPEPRKGLLEKLFRPFTIKIPIEVMATCVVVVLALYLYRTMGPEMATHVNPQEKSTVAPEQTMKASPLDSSSKSRPHEEKAREASNGPVTGETEKPAVRANGTSTGSLKKEELQAPKSSEQAAALRQTEKTRTQGPLNRSETGPAQQSVATVVSPEPQSQRKDQITQSLTGSAAPATVTEEKKRSALFGGRPAQSVVPHETVIRVYTGYREAAAEKIEGQLKRFEARNIRKEYHEDSEVFVAQIAGQSVKGLFDALKTLGDVRSADIASNPPEGYATVRIEIKGSP